MNLFGKSANIVSERQAQPYQQPIGQQACHPPVRDGQEHHRRRCQRKKIRRKSYQPVAFAAKSHIAAAVIVDVHARNGMKRQQSEQNMRQFVFERFGDAPVYPHSDPNRRHAGNAAREVQQVIVVQPVPQQSVMLKRFPQHGQQQDGRRRDGDFYHRKHGIDKVSNLDEKHRSLRTKKAASFLTAPFCFYDSSGIGGIFASISGVTKTTPFSET